MHTNKSGGFGLGVVLCLEIVHRGQVTEVCRQLQGAGATEMQVYRVWPWEWGKVCPYPWGARPHFLIQSTPTLILPYTLSSTHRHCMLLKLLTDSHIDMHLSIYLGIYFIYLSRICSSSLDYQCGHFTVTAHFKSRRQMLKHKENPSLICITADNVFFECNQCLS